MLRSSLCRRYQPLFAVVCFCLSMVFAVPGVAQVPLYQGASLGAIPYAINASGQVIGDDELYSFLWLPTPAYDLPPGINVLVPFSGDKVCIAFGINASGTVVGVSASPTLSNACFWTPGSTTAQPLYNLGGAFSVANAINASGQIVGYSDIIGPFGPDACIWQPGNPIPQDLGRLGPGSSEATAINDAGEIVGYSYTTSGNNHACLWQPGSTTPQDLGTLGGLDSYAYGINNSGQVVGQSQISSGNFHAFLWQPGSTTMQDLGSFPGGSNSYAYGINNSDQIVGYSDIGGTNHAFLWQNGKMFDLNSLFPNSSMTLSRAVYINDSGQIAEQSSNNLLSPIGHVLPNTSGNAGDVSVTLVYPGLVKPTPNSPGTTIALSANGQTISGNYTAIVDTSESNIGLPILRATFHLQGVTAGVYDVVVKSPDVTLPGAFTVQQVSPPQTNIPPIGAPQIVFRGLGTSTGKNQVREYVPSTFDFSVTNTGTQDAVDVPVWIAGLPPKTPFNVTHSPLTGINVSDVGLGFTLTNSVTLNQVIVVPLIVPLVPAGATINLQFQPTYPASLIGSSTSLQVWTTPLYSLLAAGSNSPTLFNALEQLIGQIYYGTAGTSADSNSLNSATASLLTQLSAISTAGYSSQGSLPPPTSFTQLLAQGVQLVAQKTGVTLSDNTIQTQIESVLNTALNSPTTYPDAYPILQPQAVENTTAMVVGPVDPNSVIGPLGWLTGHSPVWLAASRPVQFSVECGNESNAGAAAHDVLITAHLNTAIFDPNTVSLGEMLMVNKSLAPNPNIAPVASQYQAFSAGLSVHGVSIIADSAVALTPDQSQDSNLPPLTNPLTWDFNTSNANGFLPAGQDIHVTFTVMPKAGLPTGTSIGTMWADSTFDYSGATVRTSWPSDPNMLPALIDSDVPQSGVTQFYSPLSTNPTFTVYWHWIKPPGGSGLKDITVYRSDNNSGFVPWQITANPANLTGWSSAVYTGAVGQTYSFYSIAEDNAGNVQQVPLTYATINIVQGPLQLTLTPTSLMGGGSGSGKVTLNQAAPSGGLQVSLSSNNPAVSVPSSITVSGNSSSAPFSFTTSPVGVKTSVKLSASANGAGTSAILTLLPQPLKALTLSPNPVKGGQTVTGMVQLSGVAAVDTTMTLTSTNAAATVPKKVVVSAGTSSAQFSITTSAVTVTTVGKVTAKLGNLSKSVVLTVTP